MTPITCIEDLRVLAKRRVPRMFYDYADSGSWTESTYRANEHDLQAIGLRQRVAVDMRERSTRRSSMLVMTVNSVSSLVWRQIVAVRRARCAEEIWRRAELPSRAAGSRCLRRGAAFHHAGAGRQPSTGDG